MPYQPRRDEYTVGWICALPVEFAAAQALLDEEYEDADRDVDENDDNIYCRGLMAGHRVVIVCLPGHFGTNPAAAVATQMQPNFKGIRFGLMVGIGGGVPSATADVRLGDVVVSKPHGPFGGVVQYDMGKSTPSEFRRTGFLNTPPQILLSSVTAIQANNLLGKGTLRSRFSDIECIPTFQRRKAGPDVLFDASYHHEGGVTCKDCNVDKQLIRSQREDGAEVVIHLGTIASGNQVMKSATQRDQISNELGGVLCFEMEAAGLMNSFPCIVIRGICDYADSHKNDQWQPYAAGTAAAYAKELLSRIPKRAVKKIRRAEETMLGKRKRHARSPSPQLSSFKRPKDEKCNEEQEIELSAEDMAAVLKSLKFKRLGARKVTIRRAHIKTCKWLLSNHRYLQWINATDQREYNGLLWIKGKAGAGKSTLMKFAVDAAQETMKQSVLLSFFFSARGDDMERSTIGLYRALLVQLFERIPTLQSILNSLYSPGSNFDTDREWDVESLQTLLEKAIQKLGNSSVVCFIDALDECEEAQVREMVQFFDRVCELNVTDGILFSVCFSSRPYPHITVRKGLELVLDDQYGHAQDLANYIEAELKIGESEMAERMRIDIQKKASGIFMWVVLVIGILNKESDRGRSHGLEQKLREIPNDLDDLFHDILTRDSSNTDDLVLCIQWVLFATHPFTPDQLYYAVLSGNNPGALFSRDSDHVTKDVVERFVLDCSKGLIEITKLEGTGKLASFEDGDFTSVSDNTVQFIHESVRDFLLHENRLGRVWSQYKADFEGQSHERLKQCCLNHISATRNITNKSPEALSAISSRSNDEELHLATQKFPFLRYAVQNVFHHANISEEFGTSQARFLGKFPLREWVELNNMLETNEANRHSRGVSLLYRLAELNCGDLILSHFQPKQCLKTERERYGCPIFAASALFNFAAIRAFSLVLSTGNARKRYRHELNEELNEEYAAYYTPKSLRNFVYRGQKRFLENAAEVCPEHMMILLIQSWRYAVEAPGSDPWNILMSACCRGQASVIELLLDDRTLSAGDIDSKMTKLFYSAAKQGKESVIRFLMSTRFCMILQPYHMDHALQLAAYGGHTLIAGMLLDKGADVNTESERFGNALYMAASNARKETALLLLERGADINAQGGGCGIALHAAVAGEYLEMTTMLLERGANVNPEGGCSGSVSVSASLYGNMEIAKLLLDRGADPNAPCGIFKNALQAVSMFHHNSQLRGLLIERGAKNS